MIYFIYDQNNNAVKIGVTEDIGTRLTHLQCGNATSLTIIKTINGSYEEEKILHYHYRKYRLRGEWFIYTEEIAKDVKNKTFTTIYNKYKNDEKIITEYFKNISPFKTEKKQPKVENKNKYKAQKEYQRKKAEKNYETSVNEIQNHFVKKENAKIMAKDLKKYLVENNIKSKYGEKNIPINKILEFFEVNMKQITWQGKRERFVIGLDYAKKEV